MGQLRGVVTDITFQSEETGFTVLRLHEETSEKTHTCVGVLPTIERGESVALTGEWETNRRYGPQFSVSSFELIRPTTIKGITMLLGSGLISNIGPHRAQKIIEAFGIDTLDVLDNEPNRLLRVSGIGRKTLGNIKDAWDRQRFIRDLLLFLQQYGVTVNLAHKIYKAYGSDAKKVISNNPYSLVDDIRGVGFKKADAIAQKLGFEQDSYRRIRAGFIFVMQEASGDGHTCMPKGEALERAGIVLGVSPEKVLYSLDHMLKENVLVAENDFLYLPPYYRAEVDVGKRLHERIELATALYNKSKLDFWLKEYSRETGWNGDPKQIDAVHMAANNRVSLLTGGPGTGKTTTLQVIVGFFRSRGIQVALAAPTGRAAQRMGSISGLKASTIHRLLEFRPGRGGFTFARNESNPVPADVLIIDEVSMIDLMLMRSLLRGIRADARILFVGDSNQLPSVGAGNVLADMIDSKQIPHVELTTIFRQAASSRIVTSAHEIIHGHAPEFGNEKNDNCFFMKRNTPEDAVETIVDLVTRRLPQRYGLNPVRDIQVLSPMHRGALGTQAINSLLQQKLNNSRKKISRGEVIFAEGDKVMQIQNNYDKGVFNGDIGYVASVMDNLGLTVDFDGNVVQYEPRELDELLHAYCISVHKSQGCEFTAVVMLVTTQHYVMLQRNLIYTALTRARKLCVMVGTPKALSLAVHNSISLRRYSGLSKRITSENPE